MAPSSTRFHGVLEYILRHAYVGSQSHGNWESCLTVADFADKNGNTMNLLEQLHSDDASEWSIPWLAGVNVPATGALNNEAGVVHPLACRC
jgi:hypothetical protein